MGMGMEQWQRSAVVESGNGAWIGVKYCTVQYCTVNTSVSLVLLMLMVPELVVLLLHVLLLCPLYLPLWTTTTHWHATSRINWRYHCSSLT